MYVGESRLLEPAGTVVLFNEVNLRMLERPVVPLVAVIGALR